MQRRDFDFELPGHLIAQYPLATRRDSRMLCLDRDSGRVRDRLFRDLSDMLRPGDLLVFNDTRVMPARLTGTKTSGGGVEVLIERKLDDSSVLAMVRANRAPRPDTRIAFRQDICAWLRERHGEFWRLVFEPPWTVDAVMETIGHVPLPPYITRSDEALDRQRYQTVFARRPGAVAAPTAGLHFDQAMLAQLAQQGIATAFITLHVGAGTFQPVRVDDIRQHRMHAEQVVVTADVCQLVNRTRAQGGRVIAVGTTVVRSLETAASSGGIEPFNGETDMFITPGYRFRTVDALMTNFHFPESTLLMLVCAFGGQSAVLAAYRHAVAQQYRFFSYGDMMFIT